MPTENFLFFLNVSGCTGADKCVRKEESPYSYFAEIKRVGVQSSDSQEYDWDYGTIS